MLTKFRTTFVVLSLLLPSTVLADGLIFQLPPDGTWARFEYDHTGVIHDGKVETHKGTMTVSSVGVAQVDGEACRWIELCVELKHDDRTSTSIWKLLIPEKSLGKGADPLAHVHKAWEKRSPIAGGVLREIPDLKGTGAPQLASLRLFFHGPIKTTEHLPKAVVESKLGKLECAGHKKLEKVDRPGNFMHDRTYITRLHPSAPFGVVTFESTIKVHLDGKEVGRTTMKLKLMDLGKDAKSRIPDSK